MRRNEAKRSRSSRLAEFLGSRAFWPLILGIFIFQAVWIALTARYPMAFDEQFHLGIIRQYAHHLSPFWDAQPSGADQLGALSRDPSYLYQYLMSFPYRLISAITSSEAAQVIFLRLINIGILASALLVFRRLLGQLGASDRVRNVVLAFFVLTPVVPFLGAQINYDSLFVLMTALAFSTFLGLRSALREKSRWDWNRLMQLLLVCLFGSLVKYAFLPIALGLAVAVLVDLRFAHRKKIPLLPRYFPKVTKAMLVYAVLLAVGLGLFSERYLVNVVRYHTPIPECDQVLSIEECQGYAPWARNYMFDSWNIQPKTSEKLVYPFVWIDRALGETVFTITSQFNASGTVDYYAVTPLPIPDLLSWVIFVGGGLLSVFYWRVIKQQRYLEVLLGIAGFYVLILFVQNLLDFLHLGFIVAVHGRYLIPILPLLYLVIVQAVSRLLLKFKAPQTVRTSRKAWLTVAVFAVFALEGGGLTTMIISSHDDWFWPQSRPAQLANQYARDVLRYVVIR